MLLPYQAIAWLGEEPCRSPVRAARPTASASSPWTHPPVNALTVQGWFDVAAALDEAGRDPDTKVVVLRAEGRGFNAGVDIKEMQHTDRASTR